MTRKETELRFLLASALNDACENRTHNLIHAAIERLLGYPEDSIDFHEGCEQLASQFEDNQRKIFESIGETAVVALFYFLGLAQGLHAHQQSYN